MSRNSGLWNPVCAACASVFRLDAHDGIALCEYCRKHQAATLARLRAMVNTYNMILVEQIERMSDEDSDRYSAVYHADQTTAPAKRASFERRIQRTIEAGGALAGALVTRHALRKAIDNERHVQSLYDTLEV